MIKNIVIIFALFLIGCSADLMSECRSDCSDIIGSEGSSLLVTWFVQAKNVFEDRVIAEMKITMKDQFVCCCKIENTKNSITKYVWKSEKICSFAKIPAEKPPL